MASREFENAVKIVPQAQPHRRQTPLGLWVLGECHRKASSPSKRVRNPVLVRHFSTRGLGSSSFPQLDNSRPWARKPPSPPGKNGSGPCPTMPTAPARRGARGSRKALLIPCARHAHSCSPTKAWSISTHRAASPTIPVPSASFPEMKAVDCASSSCSLSVKKIAAIGRETVASYFGISKVHIQRARFPALSCRVSMG